MRWVRGAIFGVIGGALVVACGARTGLLAPEEQEIDAGLDAPHDVHDAADVLDVSHEPDVIEEDAPPIVDVVFPDVPIVSDCPDAGSTYVYVLGAANELYSFYPPTLSFKNIGTVNCPTMSTPNSMAVTRSGIAFSNFEDGHLFEISTANAACKATTYVPNQLGFVTYGMGYVAIADGGETLYVSPISGGIFSQGLATIDTSTFDLTFVAQYQPEQLNCELSGNAAGQLFGYCPFSDGSYFIEVDPKTAKVLSSHQLSSFGHAWAFAFWGGNFWLFTTNGSATVSTVTEYDPVLQTETAVTTAPIEIVGAGVSTCAPL